MEHAEELIKKVQEYKWILMMPVSQVGLRKATEKVKLYSKFSEIKRGMRNIRSLVRRVDYILSGDA
jgi:hypothetical protein